MASSMCAVGTSILDTGARKASVTGRATEGQDGVPGMFGLPNVANVSVLSGGSYCNLRYVLFVSSVM